MGIKGSVIEHKETVLQKLPWKLYLQKKILVFCIFTLLKSNLPYEN